MSEKQKGTKATAYKNRYNQENYEALRIVIPKGRRADIDRVIGKGKINTEVNDFLRSRTGMTEAEWKRKPEAGDPNG